MVWWRVSEETDFNCRESEKREKFDFSFLEVNISLFFQLS